MSDHTSRIYKPKEFSQMIGVSVITLQRWDRSGTLKAYRTPTDRRYYTYDQYLKYMGIEENKEGRSVIYARVSSSNQKDDLINQIDFLRHFTNAKGIIIDEDLISIIHVFSCRIYGLRKYKKAIKEDKDIEESIQDGSGTES